MPSGKPYGHPHHTEHGFSAQRRSIRDDVIRVALMCAILTLATAAIGGAIIYTVW